MDKNITLIIKWVATAISLVGASLAALDIYPWSAIILNFGAFVFLIWAIRIKDLAMITVNAGILLIYTAGLAYKLS